MAAAAEIEVTHLTTKSNIWNGWLREDRLNANQISFLLDGSHYR